MADVVDGLYGVIWFFCDRILRRVYPLSCVVVRTCVVQNIVAHVEFPPGTEIDLDGIYSRFCECTTYQRTIFPGLVLRPPQSPIVLLIFSSGRIVCTGGRSYTDISLGFETIYRVLKAFVKPPAQQPNNAVEPRVGIDVVRRKRRRVPATVEL